MKWNDSDDNETKLEKIITQKYIAIFPYSYEAWTDIRRTGYPKIFPVLNPNLGDGSLSDGDLIRRLPLPTATFRPVWTTSPQAVSRLSADPTSRLHEYSGTK